MIASAGLLLLSLLLPASMLVSSQKSVGDAGSWTYGKTHHRWPLTFKTYHDAGKRAFDRLDSGGWFDKRYYGASDNGYGADYGSHTSGLGEDNGGAYSAPRSFFFKKHRR